MSVDIAAENALTSDTWTFRDLDIPGWGDPNIAGFARQISVNVGEQVQFSVTGAAPSIDIYRAGWYGGKGFRKVASVVNVPTVQPEAAVIPNSNGGTTCTAWSVTATWNVPADATSGMYLALVNDSANNRWFYISFVVRDDAATADIVYKTSDTTWGAAYNHYGTPAAPNGSNLYGKGVGVGSIAERCHAVSYHRPVITRAWVMQTFWMACELPLIRWLERQGFTIKYTTGVDLDRKGVAELDGGKIFLSSGHDEYWSENMRSAVEQWRDGESAGRSIFMSGNEVLWRTRFEYSGDESIMWCYKDTMPGPGAHEAGKVLDPVTWTGTWKDTRWPANRPEWLLTGTDFRMNGIHDYDATIVKNPYAGHKVWGNSSLNDGDITLREVIGFEADSVRPTQPLDSYRLLAVYTRNIDGARADDNGQNYDHDGDLTWGIVAQRYSSGGATVGFGTCQWSWALDDAHDRGSGTSAAQPAQQFTMNLLRSLGAEPTTPMAGISATTELPSLDDLAGVIPTDPPGGVRGYGIELSVYGKGAVPLSVYRKGGTRLL